MIVVFVAIAIIFDMIAVSTTSANIEPFLAMASRKVRGAKHSIMLIKNAPKIPRGFIATGFLFMLQ